MKKLMVFAMAVCAMAGAFAAANEAMTKDVNVVVTSLSVRQRYPWNGKVDIDFSIDSEFPEAFAFVRFGASYKNESGETVNVPMRTFDHGTSWFCASSGTYRVTWDSTTDVPGLMATNLQYTVTANMAKYMVVDLSKGTSATADNPMPPIPTPLPPSPPHPSPVTRSMVTPQRTALIRLTLPTPMMLPEMT